MSGKISEVAAVYSSSLVICPFLIIGAFLKCAIAKTYFEKNKVCQGFEALARAQYLLRSKSSLGKMKLLYEVLFISVKVLSSNNTSSSI